MGKAQSKRSVDITTDVKKDDTVEEGTGKVEKIDDVDQVKPQLNGDTIANETETNDKIGEIESTEEKDLSTEKDQQQQQQQKVDTETGGDNVQCEENKHVNEDTVVVEENNKDVTIDTSTTEANESSKKKKKEKGKKWSFRNISFGKRDKQKPTKKDEVTINGECDKVPEEANEELALATNGENKVEENGVEAGVEVDVEEKKETEVDVTKVNDVDKTETPLSNGQAENASVELKKEMITVEEKKTELMKDNIEDKQKVAAPPMMIETTAEILKEKLLEQTNGSMKPEVIEENISDANNIKVEEKIQMECEIKKEHIDSSEISDIQNVHSVVPPPLPFNPPPSPVMVFALSDTKLNDSNHDNTQIEELVNIGIKMSTSIKTDKLVSVAEEEDVQLSLEEQKSEVEIEVPIITHTIHEEEIKSTETIEKCDQPECNNEINLTENQVEKIDDLPAPDTEICDLLTNADKDIALQKKDDVFEMNKVEKQLNENNLIRKDIENIIVSEVDDIIKLAEEKISTDRITDVSNFLNDVTKEAIEIVHDKVETTAADLSAEILNKSDQIVELLNDQNHLSKTDNNDIILENNKNELEVKVAVNDNNILNTNIDKPIALIAINGEQSIICNNSIDGDNIIGDKTSITESKNGFSDNHVTSPTEIVEGLNGQAENNGTIIDTPSKLNSELGQDNTLINAVPVAQ